MNIITSGILAILLLAVCFGSRRWALLGMVSGVFLLTQGQSVDVAGVNLFPIRFLEAAGFMRVLIRRELKASTLNRTDWLLLLLYNYSAFVWTIRAGTLSTEQLAFCLDPTTCYLTLRSLIGDLEDLGWLLERLTLVLIPFTALVYLERLTSSSSFSAVGISTALYVRNGVPRCQGSFRHAILLGSVAASFLALYVGQWLADTRRPAPALGAILCLILIVLANSGGPLTSLLALVCGWSLWYLRDRMRQVRLGLVALLVLLTISMKAPIWYLPFKISSIVGGGGFHRGMLMDQAWQDLGRWWLAGMPMSETIHWFPYVHSVVGGADITNEFLVFAIKAGLPAVVLLILVLVSGFRQIGNSRKWLTASHDERQSGELLLWGLGVALFVHVVSWLGVGYFDQSYVIWLLHLAAASACAQALRHDTAEASLSPDPGVEPVWLGPER